MNAYKHDCSDHHDGGTFSFPVVQVAEEWSQQDSTKRQDRRDDSGKSRFNTEFINHQAGGVFQKREYGGIEQYA